MSCQRRCFEEAIFGNAKPTIVVLPYRGLSVMGIRGKGHLHRETQVWFSGEEGSGSGAMVETMNFVVGMFGAGSGIFVSVDKL